MKEKQKHEKRDQQGRTGSPTRGVEEGGHQAQRRYEHMRSLRLQIKSMDNDRQHYDWDKGIPSLSRKTGVPRAS